jgi:hypothetical protein
MNRCHGFCGTVLLVTLFAQPSRAGDVADSLPRVAS